MTLYHYTKLENLPLIVQKDKLEFIMTDYWHFDDRSEGQYAIKVPQKVYKRWGNDVSKRFVLSLCEEFDNLAMLKEYANNASGIVLGIDTNYIQDKLCPCKYDPSDIWIKEEHMRSIKNTYNTIEPINNEIVGLSEKVRERNLIREVQTELMAFKDPHYYYEKEWRIMKNVCPDNLNYRFKNGKLIHFYYYNLAINALVSIHVGPNNSESVLKEIEKYLRIIGLTHIKPIMLKVPYKSH